MNMVHRNSALQRLLAAADERTLSMLRKVTYTAAETWSSGAAANASLWFPERGMLVLEQPQGKVLVEVALIGWTTALHVPGQSGWHLRALCDGYAYAMPAQAAASLCPDVLLHAQNRVMQDMASWVYCQQHHSPVHSLADRLLWLHRLSGDEVQAWSVHNLPGSRRLLPAQTDRAVRELQRAGAVSLQGEHVQVRDAGVLCTWACGCHASRVSADAATAGQML